MRDQAYDGMWKNTNYSQTHQQWVLFLNEPVEAGGEFFQFFFDFDRFGDKEVGEVKDFIDRGGGERVRKRRNNIPYDTWSN